MRALPKRALHIGRDIQSGEPINLSLARLSEHVDVVGPTGCGKTRSIMLKAFQELAPMTDVSVIAVTCKGDYATMCSDWAIAHGLTDKLVMFKPGAGPLVGFNPLKRNGWPPERHAKMARTAVLAARGEHSLDETPQLARLLFLCLAVALEQGFTLIEAARLLRPGRSAFRTNMLRVVESEFLRESLQWFDSLKDSRQEEIAASTVGRLENFVGDPLIRAILTEQERCLDIGDVIRNRKKLCIDVGLYNPLVPDDAKTMLRLLINNVLAHKFDTPAAAQTPTILLLDEIQEYATEDLATALTLGRELKLFVVMAHQFPSQLKLSAEDSHLFESVQHCCRTKIIFGGVHVSELEGIVKELVIDQFNPRLVKDERKTPYFEAVESTRDTVTRGVSVGGSVGVNSGASSATARGRSRGNSRQWGASHSHSDAFSMVHSSATNAGVSMGETLLPNGETIAVHHNVEGTSEADASGTTRSDTYGEFQSQGEQYSTSESMIDGTQSGVSAGLNGSVAYSVSRAPFYEYLKRWIVSSRTFQTLDEFLTISLQTIKAQPCGHFVVKVPEHKAIFVRAHFVRVPWVSNAVRTRALQRVHERLLPSGCNAVEAFKPVALIDGAVPSPTQAPMIEFSEPPPPSFLEKKKK